MALTAGLATSLAGAPRVKIPADAPYCARPGTRQVFVSPMGEPFRAAADQPYPSAAWAAQADSDHDGWISRAEFIADARRFFATLDTDHDGRLTPEEVEAYERHVAPEIALYGSIGDRRDAPLIPYVRPGLLGPGRSNYGGEMGAGRYAWLNVPEPVAAADSDIDRLVSVGEFAAAAGRRFDALDRKEAGRLRLADLPKTLAQQAAEGPCQPRPTEKTLTRQADEREQRPHQ